MTAASDPYRVLRRRAPRRDLRVRRRVGNVTEGPWSTAKDGDVLSNGHLAGRTVEPAEVYGFGTPVDVVERGPADGELCSQFDQEKEHPPQRRYALDR